MIDIGVARPRAHGQAMINTATAASRALANRGSGPSSHQAAPAAAAVVITAGTNQAATRSASRWMGARLRWASPTIRTIWASRVSLPTRSAIITKLLLPLTVPAVTRSPGPFSTGIGSPVSIDSSTALWPATTVPSTGTFSPGRTRRRSPGSMAASGTSRSALAAGPEPGARRRAVGGVRSSRARSAAEVRPRARSSST